MAIITISRGSFSGGKTLAECLARRLNYHCIDRDVVAQRASARGVSPGDLLAALDTPPTTALYTLNHRKYIYLVLIQAAIAAEMSSGNAVYHGLVGHRLFPEDFPALRLRVIAPLEFRIRAAQERMRSTRPEAIAYIEKMDDQRSKWTRYLYGVDWEDPSLYDFVVNLQRLTVEQACRLVEAMIKQGGFEFTPNHMTSMQDFVLATRVRAALACDPMTSNLEMEVLSTRGDITIRGDLCDQADEIQRVAAAVPTVRTVNLQESAMPELASPS
jgi:cytidylate kinase